MKCSKCGWVSRETQRGTPANAYYWGFILQTLSESLGYTPEECHAICKYKFLQREIMTIGDEKIEIAISRKLSKKEFADYCQRIELWMNSLGIYLKEQHEQLV